VLRTQKVFAQKFMLNGIRFFIILEICGSEEENQKVRAKMSVLESAKHGTAERPQQRNLLR
jgi:hypothetical protein